MGLKFRRNHSISLRFRDKHVFVFYAEIQDGHQKWLENDFWEKLQVECPNTLLVKKFVKIALSRSVYEINTFLYLTKKFKMAAKTGLKLYYVIAYQNVDE